MQAHANTLKALHTKLHQVRRANLPASGLLELQSDVVRKIVRLERRVRELRTRLGLERKRLAGAGGYRLSKAEATEEKRRVARDARQINMCQSLLRLTKSISDGLVFSVLPKWDIKPLSSKETAGFISGKQGLKLELRILRGLLRKGEIALMNDITNCLRHGDITVPRTPAPAILEVKSGSAQNPRTRRQMAKAQEVAAYLSKDAWNNWQGTGLTLIRRPLERREQHHRRRLATLIRNAINRGAATSWPEPGLCYVSLGRSSVTDVLRTEFPKFREPPLAYTLFPCSQHPSYYYPLTLSIADSDAWWAVVSGVVSLVILIDPARVKALGRAHGLTIEQIHKSEWQWAVSRKDGSDEIGPLKISHQLFARVAREFLDLRWFMDEVVSRFLQVDWVASALEGTRELGETGAESLAEITEYGQRKEKTTMVRRQD